MFKMAFKFCDKFSLVLLILWKWGPFITDLNFESKKKLQWSKSDE